MNRIGRPKAKSEVTCEVWTRCQPWAPPNGMATVVVYTSQEMAVPWQSEVTCVERGPWGPSSHWELPPSLVLANLGVYHGACDIHGAWYRAGSPRRREGACGTLFMGPAAARPVPRGGAQELFAGEMNPWGDARLAHLGAASRHAKH